MMRKSLAPTLLSPLLALWLCAAAAEPTVIPAPPAVNAKAHILMDAWSGQVLAENNADERLEPASLTKLMTAYTVFRELKAGNIALTDRVRVSKKAWRTGGSRMFIEVNSEVKVEDLLRGMIVQSGNDASVALAEHVAGSEEAFADLMNHHAQRLGMSHSHFVNSMGLPAPEHYSSARDMALVTQAIIREFPDYYGLYSELEYTYNGITQPNRNRLLRWEESVDGVKTGYTKAAGYCLVASAERDSMRLVSVVLGTESQSARFRVSQALLNWGFRFYETHRLYAAGQPVSRVRVWKGDSERLDIGPLDDIYVTVPRGQYDRLDASMEIRDSIIAPIDKGAALGSVQVVLDDEPVAEQPLVALNGVAEGGLWRKLVDSGLMWFE
jgi:D-alanyl-D-alanine carboxypeptidase (penicillin-binding protein 5/6)